MRSTTLTAALLALLSTAAAHADVPAYLSAQQALEQLQQGTLSSQQLVKHALAQINANDKQGPALHAITDLSPTALQEAKQLDQERKAGHLRGPLHGLPVLIKANIATNDQLPTTAGALVLKGFTTRSDAPLVAQLRAAGAIILGKTNLSEWANFRGEGSASGWSALGGQTKNPYLLSQSPCGSSSGSAVAVAADYVALTVGTETDGSILCPSAMNHVVGLKPTHGAIAGQGIIPIASSQDTAGPMTRTVEDAALLLDVLATPTAKQRYGNLTDALHKQSVTSVVLIRTFDSQYPAIKAMLDTVKAQLQQQGIKVNERVEWALPDSAYQAELEVLVYEYKRDLNQWLHDHHAPAAAKDIASIIAFNQQQGKTALAFYGQQYLEKAQAIHLERDKANYLKARQHSKQAAETLLNADLGTGRVIIAPTAGPAWAIDHVKGDQFNFETASAAAISGYPALTIPGGFDGALPLGISLIGQPWSEPQLLGLAKQLQDSLHSWQAPRYLTSAPTTTPK